MKRILERMAKIGRMERGKPCQMAGRPHYNHQTWQDGRNAVRYVPVDETAALQEAIKGYRQFIALAEQYADEVIRMTRRETGQARKHKEPKS
jgi:predicted ArsR family transcriptional regulator